MHQTQGHPSTLKKNSNGPKSTDRHCSRNDSGKLSTPLSTIDRSARQKINKETSELLHTLDQIDIVDI
jgi:hypothetical protein